MSASSSPGASCRRCPPTRTSSISPGRAVSALGLFLLVFGIQEGETYDWGTIAGPITVWGLIITGIAVLAVFVLWQKVKQG